MDDVVTVTPDDENQCIEIWHLSDWAVACVEMRGTVKRMRNTGDRIQDITLSFDTYSIMAAIGNTNTATAPDLWQFSAKDVDFSAFLGYQGRGYRLG